MTETIAPAAPLATFLKGAGVPREHQAAASTAVLMWLEQLGPNTAAATLLHTAEALKQVQDRNAELLGENERLLKDASELAAYRSMYPTPRKSDFTLAGGVEL